MRELKRCAVEQISIKNLDFLSYEGLHSHFKIPNVVITGVQRLVVVDKCLAPLFMLAHSSSSGIT